MALELESILNNKYVRWGSIFSVLIFTFYIRTIDSGNHSLTVDERINMLRVIQPAGVIIRSLASQGPPALGEDISPPLYHLLVHAFIKVNSTDFWARLPGVLAGVGSVAVVYILGSILFSRMSGLLAGLLLSANLYHVTLSQTVRPYGVMLFFSGLALLAMVLALRRNAPWTLVAGVCLALSFYTNYTASAHLFGFGAAWAIVWAVRLSFGGDWRAAWRESKVLGVGIGLAVLLYLPWVRQHLFALNYALTTYPPVPGASFNWAQVAGSLKEFMPTGFSGADWYVSLALGLLGLGCLWSFRRGKGGGVVLLFFWAMAPLFIFVLTKSPFPFYARRFCGMLFPLSLLIALGIECSAWAACLAARAIFGGDWRKPAFVAGVLGALLFTLPNFAAYGPLMSWRVSPGKELALDAYLLRNNCRYLSALPQHTQFLVDWYLPGAFEPLEKGQGEAYRRAMLLLPLEPLPLFPGLVPIKGGRFQSELSFEAFYLGVLRKGRLLMEPNEDGVFIYQDDFKGHKLYSDAAQYQNLSVDYVNGCLDVFQRGGQGDVRYVFARPAQYAPSMAQVEAEVALTVHPMAATNDWVRVSVVGPSGEDIRIGEFSAEDYSTLPVGNSAPSVRSIRKTFQIPEETLALSEVKLILTMNGGLTNSVMRVKSFALISKGKSEPMDNDFPVRFALEELEKSGVLEQVNSGYKPIGNETVYAFMLDDRFIGTSQVGSPVQRAEFLALHPGVQPVGVLRDRNGRPRCELYDPYLTEPFVILGQAKERAYEWKGESPGDPTSLSIVGQVDHPRIHMGDAQTVIPVRMPSGSFLQFVKQGRGEVLFRPLFDNSLIDSKQFFLQDRIRANPYNPNLQCEGAEPCQLMYLFQSKWPIQELTVSYQPRLINDPGRLNYVELSYSVEPGKFQTLHRLESDGSGIWCPIKTPVNLRVPLEHPQQTVILRVRMFTEGSQLWSSSDSPMAIHAVLDTGAWAGVPFPGRRFSLSATSENPNDFSVVFSPAPPLSMTELLMKPTLGFAP